MNRDKQETVLVLGAYGLIGAEVVRELEGAGFHVVGLGRNAQTAYRVMPNIDWRFHDISALTNPSDWDDPLVGINHVVNCSGALQSGGNTDLEKLHHTAIDALAKACAERNIRLVQISAVGVGLDAGTEFMQTKARGDAAIQAAMQDFVIIRPGLVLSRSGYGGTQLLRMIAAMPLMQCVSYGDALVQTIGIADVTACVLLAVKGDYPPKASFDLVEKDVHTLAEVTAAVRTWLGFRESLITINVPNFVARAVSKIADALGILGWRSPLRSTAIQVLKTGVIGKHDARALAHTHSLSETLAKMPARSEYRVAAQMALVMPLLVALLSVFWIVSGVMGFVSYRQAANVLTDTGWPNGLAIASVLFWSVVDIILGIGLMIRKYAAKACLAMITVGLIYVVFATVFVPTLWLDPLGPLVKIFPSMGLALVTYFLVQER